MLSLTMAAIQNADRLREWGRAYWISDHCHRRDRHLGGLWALPSPFGRVAGIGGHSTLQLWQFVDLNSFSSAAMGGRTRIGSAILIAAVGTIAAWLGYLLWKSKGSGTAGDLLAWAATLTWTLLINVYVPMYDGLLMVVCRCLTLSALQALEWSDAGNWMVLYRFCSSHAPG